MQAFVSVKENVSNPVPVTEVLFFEDLVKRNIVKRDFRMPMLAQDFAAFGNDRLVAKRCAFRGDAHDTYVFWCIHKTSL